MIRKNTLNVMYTNARSVMHRFKRDELKVDMERWDLDIVGVTESWLHMGIEDGEVFIPGYTLFRRDRCLGDKRRGVAIC